MPRRADSKCIACAQLSAAQAQQLHGPGGDSCWDKKRCHRRRSHYRHRREQNEQRRVQYRQQVSRQFHQSGMETMPLAPPEPAIPYANLYIWREKRKDAPVHAIAASVVVDGKKVLEVAPIHCAGYRKRQLERYMEDQVMPYLKARYGITHFANEIRLEPMECPIAECPLSDRFKDSEVTNG